MQWWMKAGEEESKHGKREVEGEEEKTVIKRRLEMFGDSCGLSV